MNHPDVITAAWACFDARKAHGVDSREYRIALLVLDEAKYRARHGGPR